MMSATMIGLDVAPVAPQARLRATSSGSMESSHSFVPAAMSDCNGVSVLLMGASVRVRARGGAARLHYSIYQIVQPPPRRAPAGGPPADRRFFFVDRATGRPIITTRPGTHIPGRRE